MFVTKRLRDIQVGLDITFRHSRERNGTLEQLLRANRFKPPQQTWVERDVSSATNAPITAVEERDTFSEQKVDGVLHNSCAPEDETPLAVPPLLENGQPFGTDVQSAPKRRPIAVGVIVQAQPPMRCTWWQFSILW